MASSVLVSFSANMLTEVAKKHLLDFLNTDIKLTELKESLDKKLSELKKSLSKIDAGVSHSGLASDWLDEIEQCRYEMEDIEESMDEGLKRKIVTKFLKANIKCVTSMQSKVARIEHAKEAGHSKSSQVPNSNHERLTDVLLVRGEDNSKIVQELTTTRPGVWGVSIIGIGGIGKTTLARAIAAEASIQSYFTCILSPTLSSDFNSRSVLDYIDGVGLPSDKRVLILLDGVHSVTPEEWRSFRCKWQKDFNPESKILITTQNPKVADVTATSKHCLDSLQPDECFLLIQNLANANENIDEVDDQAIVHNKKELVDMCKGLPLLARQIGLLLSEYEPGHRRDGIIEITTKSPWKVQGLERVLVNLKLVSLIANDPNLRRCLAYCSLFPQDYEFEKENLVQLWMAEGFAPPSTDTSYLEQTTRRYFDELLSRCLFQTSTLSGEKPRYKLHELFYDMAVNVASKTFCHKISISSLTRHFSLGCEYFEDDEEFKRNLPFCEIQKKCSGLRTFLLFHESGKMIDKNPTFFHSLTRIRVLDLSHTNLTNLEPKSISKLKHLRYLDLSHTPVVNLPRLFNSPELQVLKLNHCDNLQVLPNDLTELTTLVSLEVNTRGLGSMPSEIGKLTNLQRLDLFIVGKKKGFKIAELRELNDLRKSLRITRLENVENKKEAQEAMLHNKGKLERVELEWTATNNIAGQVLEGLEPPKNLKELIIRNYCGATFPDWLSKTRLLESIHLNRCKALPSIDQLPMLKTFRVEAMHEIAHDLSGQNGTAVVETLILCDMSKLNQWIVLAASNMPELHSLRVEKCQKLLTLPPLDCLKELEKLEISWCTQLKKLPKLPQSLKSLVIKNSDILTRRCQVGGAD